MNFFTDKNEEKIKKNIFFDLVQIKNSFGHFRKLKSNTKQKIVSNFIEGYCSLTYEDSEGLCKFSNKNINF